MPRRKRRGSVDRLERGGVIGIAPTEERIEPVGTMMELKLYPLAISVITSVSKDISPTALMLELLQREMATLAVRVL